MTFHPRAHFARSYLDWNATAPLHPEARAAMAAALDVAGNPSSPHAEGRKARGLVETAREAIASALGVHARAVFFTSGATEAANWVLTPAFAGRPRLAALLVGATEHACVHAGHRFAGDRVTHIPVDGQGRIDVDALTAQVAMLTAEHGFGSVMVAVQSANNETGVLQPLDAVAKALVAHGAILVCDAVQSIGRGDPLPSADIVFLSAHKFGGPKGIGAVVITNDNLSPEPLLKGGGQERRQRGGTENVIGIAGFAAALTAAVRETPAYVAHTRHLQTILEQSLKDMAPQTQVFGENAPRLPNTTCFAMPGVTSETALVALDLAGVALSSGSACSSGKVAASHVLTAMGFAPDLARGALRLSTGLATTQDDIAKAIAALSQFLERRAQRAVA